jgi:hypothetical protein
MEIRKSAWHYKLFTTSFESGFSAATESNFCSYFWRVVGGMLKILCVIVVALCLLLGIGYMIFQFPLYCAGGAFAAIAVINAPRVVNLVRGGASKEPGLLRAYLRARKDKICPLITFVDDDDWKG